MLCYGQTTINHSSKSGKQEKVFNEHRNQIIRKDYSAIILLKYAPYLFLHINNSIVININIYNVFLFPLKKKKEKT